MIFFTGFLIAPFLVPCFWFLITGFLIFPVFWWWVPCSWSTVPGYWSKVPDFWQLTGFLMIDQKSGTGFLIIYRIFDFFSKKYRIFDNLSFYPAAAKSNNPFLVMMEKAREKGVERKLEFCLKLEAQGTRLEVFESIYNQLYVYNTLEKLRL